MYHASINGTVATSASCRARRWGFSVSSLTLKRVKRCAIRPSLSHHDDVFLQVLYLYEIHIAEAARGKGLGKFLVQVWHKSIDEIIVFYTSGARQIALLIAGRARMRKVICTVFKGCAACSNAIALIAAHRKPAQSAAFRPSTVWPAHHVMAAQELTHRPADLLQTTFRPANATRCTPVTTAMRFSAAPSKRSLGFPCDQSKQHLNLKRLKDLRNKASTALISAL